MITQDGNDSSTVLIADRSGEVHVAPVLAIRFGYHSSASRSGAPIVSFSDGRLEAVLIAAASLPRNRRDAFMRAVAGKLSAEPTDAQVREAIAGGDRLKISRL